MVPDEITPIWGPDDSILTFVARDNWLLPQGRIVLKPDPGNARDRKKPTQTMIAFKIEPRVASQYGVGPTAAHQAQVLPIEERHITLVYMGEQDQLERKRLHDFTRQWMAKSDWSTFNGKAQGWGTFNPGSGKKPVLWMSWDIPGLQEMRADLVEELRDARFEFDEEHDFLPHETVAYFEDDEIEELPPFPDKAPRQDFGSLVVAEDDLWTEYPFPMTMSLLEGSTMSLTAALESAATGLEGLSNEELAALIAAGGADRNRGNAEALRRYWTVGKGGAKIRWGTGGDWKRCYGYLKKHMGPRAKGYCFSGDTEFLTRDGVMTFAEAAGTQQLVLTEASPAGHHYGDVRTDNGYWVEAPIESFGEQRVLSVTLRRNGVRKIVKATPEHQWFTATARQQGSVIRLRRTDELRTGMTLSSLRPTSVVAEKFPMNPGIMAGIVFGDGSYGHLGANGGRVDLHGEKVADLLKYFDGARILPQKDLPSGLECVRVAGLPLGWRSLPTIEDGDDYLYGWLAGYIAADGAVNGDGSISISSQRREHMEFAQMVAHRLGLPVRGIGTYVVTTPYREEPFDRYVLKFGKMGFPPQMLLRERHRSALTAAGGTFERSRWVVESVVDNGEVEEVFCAVVPETESFVLADNLWVHNCQLRHKEMTRMWTGDMKHRIMYGWGGKPDLYWAKVASHSLFDEHNAVLVATSGDQMPEENPILMLLSGQQQAPVEFHIPLLLPEGIESGDGRTFKQGVVDMRALPIPLLWQPNSMQGHDGAAIVGRIDHAERVEGGIGNATGVFDNSPLAMEAVRMIREGFLRGVSADLDQFEAKIKGKGPGVSEAKEKKDDKEDETITPDKMDILKGRIMAATLVAKPAFEECVIKLVEAGAPPDGAYAQPLTPGEQEIRQALAALLREEAMASFAITASAGFKAAPIYPPMDWFSDPGLTKPTHLSITEDGRVFGHIAAWGVNHIGMNYGVKPPKSRSGYAYFRTGLLRTKEGSDVRVGQLTLAGGHASLYSDVRETVKHYDDTASAWADVTAGEDRYGIWVAGALRPTVTPEQIRAARASSPSGDWRPINGMLELVAVCSVNVPGFPVVEACVASGEVLALVAAGVAPLYADRMAMLDPAASVAALRGRMHAPLKGKAQELAARMNAPYERKAMELSAKMARSRMLSQKPVSEARRQAMVKKGWALGPDGSFSIVDLVDLKRAIRTFNRSRPEDFQRVRNHIEKRAKALGAQDLIPEDWTDLSVLSTENPSAAEFKDYSTEKRKELSKAGKAMPGGRYPIANLQDLKNAIHAYGRGDPKDKPKIRRHIMKRARALGHPELIPDKWAKLSALEADVLMPLTAAARSYRGKDWDETKHVRNDIGQFRKIYYRLRNSPGSGDAEVKAAIEAIEEVERTSLKKGSTDPIAAAEAQEALMKASESDAIDPTTQIEVIKAADQMADIMDRFEVRGADTMIKFDQLPTEIQNIMERYMKEVNLEERITKHFNPYIEGDVERSVKDVINFLERIIVDDQMYREGYDKERA